MRFAITVENLSNRQASRQFDFVIGIDEGQAKPRTKTSSDSRLADAHQPDEHNRAHRRRIEKCVGSHIGGGYTAAVAIGQRAARVMILAFRDWSRMIRMIVWILVVVALAGGAIWLSRMDTTKPLTRVEKTVPADALPR